MNNLYQLNQELAQYIASQINERLNITLHDVKIEDGRLIANHNGVRQTLVMLMIGGQDNEQISIIIKTPNVEAIDNFTIRDDNGTRLVKDISVAHTVRNRDRDVGLISSAIQDIHGESCEYLGRALIESIYSRTGIDFDNLSGETEQSEEATYDGDNVELFITPSFKDDKLDTYTVTCSTVDEFPEELVIDVQPGDNLYNAFEEMLILKKAYRSLHDGVNHDKIYRL